MQKSANDIFGKMFSDIKAYCENCKNCLTIKSSSRIRAPLVPLPVGYPFERVAMDILGPLPMTENGNKYVLVFSEYLTKFATRCAISDISAKTVAEKFLEEIILRHGSPKKLLTDQGKNFTSKLISELCILCQIKKSQTTPYHPQCDGLVERFNKTLSNMLAMYVNERHNDWDRFLSFCFLAYNSSNQESTKFSPCFLLYGRNPILPTEIAFSNNQGPEYIELSDYVTEISTLIKDSWQIARRNIGKAHEVQKFNYDKRTKSINFEIGDLVYLYTPAVKVQYGQTPKFSPPMERPIRNSRR